MLREAEVRVATDARALLEMDGGSKVVCGEHFVRDLERLLQADWSAQAVSAGLEEDLVSDVVVRSSSARIFESVRDCW
jgi:hypothetical protein